MKKYRLVQQEGYETEVLGEQVIELGFNTEILLIKGDYISSDQLIAFKEAYEKLNPEKGKIMIVNLAEHFEVSKLILEEIEDELNG